MTFQEMMIFGADGATSLGHVRVEAETLSDGSQAYNVYLKLYTYFGPVEYVWYPASQEEAGEIFNNLKNAFKNGPTLH